MITERALLTIRRNVPRPAPGSVGRFSGAATVHLADAMDGRSGIGYQVKAVSPGAATFAGPALTCYAGADDTLAILAALELAQPGDVIVAATDGFRRSAVVGDLFAAMATTASVTAIVTDGLARDSEGRLQREQAGLEGGAEQRHRQLGEPPGGSAPNPSVHLPKPAEVANTTPTSPSLTPDTLPRPECPAGAAGVLRPPQPPGPAGARARPAW